MKQLQQILFDHKVGLINTEEAEQQVLNLFAVMPTLQLSLDQLDNWEWVVKCNGEIVYNAGMFEDGKKDALYWIYMNARCYKRQ